MDIKKDIQKTSFVSSVMAGLLIFFIGSLLSLGALVGNTSPFLFFATGIVFVAASIRSIESLMVFSGVFLVSFIALGIIGTNEVLILPLSLIFGILLAWGASRISTSSDAETSHTIRNTIILLIFVALVAGYLWWDFTQNSLTPNSAHKTHYLALSWF